MHTQLSNLPTTFMHIWREFKWCFFFIFSLFLLYRSVQCRKRRWILFHYIFFLSSFDHLLVCTCVCVCRESIPRPSISSFRPVLMVYVASVSHLLKCLRNSEIANSAEFKGKMCIEWRRAEYSFSQCFIYLILFSIPFRFTSFHSLFSPI